MVFGLTDDKKVESKKTEKSKKTAKNSNADEAAEMLKKMEAKKASGDCPFC